MVSYDSPVTALPGFGEQTAETLRRRLRGSRSPKTGPVTVAELERAGGREGGLLDTTLNKRQKRALTEKTASASLAWPETVERERTTSGQPTTTNVGDFRVDRQARKDAWNRHQERSAYAQEQDEERRARVTTDVDKWERNPASFDFPGIDTPTRSPRRQEKDREHVDADALLRPYDVE